MLYGAEIQLLRNLERQKKLKRFRRRRRGVNVEAVIGGLDRSLPERLDGLQIRFGHAPAERLQVCRHLLAERPAIEVTGSVTRDAASVSASSGCTRTVSSVAFAVVST